MSILAVYSSGRNDSLFVGAIAGSVAFPTHPQVFQLEWQFDRFVNETGCAGSFDQLECLQWKETTTLQAANIPSPYPGASGIPDFFWTPTIDGDFIQDCPYLLIEQGKFVKIPIMVSGKSLHAI